MSGEGRKSYSELQKIKSDIEGVFASSKGSLEALSDTQLGIVAEQYGIQINPSDRLQTLKILESNASISAWRMPFSKGDVVAAATAVAAGGAVGVASQIDDNKEELQQQAAQTAREAIANVTSSVAEKVEQKTSENPMVGMIRKNFGQSLIQAGYSVPELTKMLDVDADGIITHAEIMLLIVKMTGTPPPPWVVTSIFEILDANQDGVVTVAEWHGFLEEMGFESTIISSPTPAVVTEEIEEVYDELDTLEENIPPVQIIEDPIPTPVTEEISIDSSEEVVEESQSNNEEIIRQLLAARLSSDEKEIITGAKNSICSIKIERIERTLMVTDHYRGGHSVLGLLDGGSSKVLVMLPKSENDVVTKFAKGDIVEANAVIVSWSSGLKIAKMAGTDARKV
jgi:hypothetical protein